MKTEFLLSLYCCLYGMAAPYHGGNKSQGFQVYFGPFQRALNPRDSGDEAQRQVLGAIESLSGTIKAIERRLEVLEGKLNEKINMSKPLSLDTGNVQALEGQVKALDTKVSGINSTLQTIGATLKAHSFNTESLALVMYNMTAYMSGKFEALENRARETEIILAGFDAKFKILLDALVHAGEAHVNITRILEGIQQNLNTGKSCNETDEISDKIGQIFSGANFTGQSYVYNLDHSSKYEGCYTLPEGTWSSVQTFGSCFRLFFSEICNGYSRAIYPGSEFSHDFINSKLAQVQAIGPCFENEFEFSSVLNTTTGVRFKKNLTDYRQIPDLVESGLYQSYLSNSTKVNAIGNPFENYFLENGTRIKFLRAFIFSRHLLSHPPESNIDNSSFWNSLDKDNGDELGFSIPLELGGPPNEIYNVFPQSRSNAFEWKKLTDQIPGYIQSRKRTDYVYLSLTFEYKNEQTTRPHGFYYYFYVFRTNRKAKIFYGFLRN